MGKKFDKVILNAMNADSYSYLEHIQSLWSGYGSIDRILLEGGEHSTAILKHIRPGKSKYPSASHIRKLKSYQTEIEWYKNYAQLCDESCRVPKFFAASSHEEEQLIILEDLDAAGYPIRRHSMTLPQQNACLSWMANFHATFMNKEPIDLWEMGTYWHLETRQEELQKMSNTKHKKDAHIYDTLLNNAKYKTIIHGDAKPANFCFSQDDRVAAVDFQYVGGGCGMKDLVYFLWDNSNEYQTTALENYFKYLENALNKKNTDVNFTELKAEWSELYFVAQDDFERFLQGWML